MTIDYYILNPSGNITILITTKVDEKLHKNVASKIMNLHPEAEQAGFVGINKDGLPFLKMAGGEFCGNATLCTSALYLHRHGIKPNESANIKIDSSGAEMPISVKLTCDSEAEYHGTVEMPSPVKIESKIFNLNEKEYELPVVNFGGIEHIISEIKMSQSEAEEAAVKWCKDISAPCLGIMFVDDDKLTPLVYAPGADTLCWESSCASGTTAAGVYFAAKENKKTDISFNEPGGILRIQAAPGKAPELTNHLVIEKKLSAEIEI